MNTPRFLLTIGLCAMVSTSSLAAEVKADSRVQAVTGAKRSHVLPDVPMLSEAGFPGRCTVRYTVHFGVRSGWIGQTV